MPVESRIHRAGKRCVWAAAVLAVAVTQAAARTSLPPQEQAPLKLQKPLAYEVSAVLKLIHVYVTDKKGKPVQNLSRDDFSVTDNGQPMTLTEFEKHTLEPAPMKTAVLTPAGAPIKVPEASAIHRATRKFFLFFDLVFNNARGMKKAKTAALHFLDEKVRPDDEVGILSYSVFKGVSVHEYLTTDHGKIRDVLNRIDRAEIGGRAQEIEDWHWRLAQEPVPPWEPAGKMGYFVLEDLANREELKKTAQNFILRLTDLAKALRYVPGEKQLILFSTGVPSSVIYGFQAGAPDRTIGLGARFDNGALEIRTQNEAMNREFAASGCTFFIFDTRESAKDMDLFLYDKQTFEINYRGVFLENRHTSTANDMLLDEKITGINSLKRLSNLTGGKYYANINRYEDNLDQVHGLTGTFYVIGYPIGEQWDGRFHEVKVAVRQKGYEVRAQAGYFNPKPFRDYTDLEKQLHLYDLVLNARAFSRIPAAFPMAALAFGVEERTGLGILARIPRDVVDAFAGERIEFVAIVFDGRGDIRDVLRREAYMGQSHGRDAVFTAESPLPPGDYTSRLVIRDMDTGKGAVASARATIGKRPAAGLLLCAPLVLVEGSRGLYYDAGPRRAKEAISWVDVYAYDRSLLSPIPAEMPVSADKIRVIIPFSVSGGIKPEIAMTAYLINSISGERSAVVFSRTGQIENGTMKSLALEIPLAGIAPGKYFLHFHAEDLASKLIGHTSTTIILPRR